MTWIYGFFEWLSDVVLTILQCLYYALFVVLVLCLIVALVYVCKGFFTKDNR